MASLQKIRQRTNLINSIKKITKAMELVATSKLRKLQTHLDKVREFASIVEEMISKVFLEMNNEEIKEIFTSSKSESTLFIIINSDLGLSGSYNSDIFKVVNAIVKSTDKVILFGRKAVNYYQFDKEQIIKTLVNLDDFVTFDLGQEAVKEALNLFNNGKIKEIKIIYSKFISVVTSSVEVEQLLPYPKIQNIKANSKNKSELEFLPNKTTIFRSALPLFLGSVVYSRLAESKVSEMANRRIAMENSSKNAGKLIDELKLEYNRRRQSSITQEIAEIVGGSEE